VTCCERFSDPIILWRRAISRPRARVVATTGRNHRPVLSTVRRGPPPAAGGSGLYPGRQVASVSLRRGEEPAGRVARGRSGGGTGRPGGRVRSSLAGECALLLPIGGGAPGWTWGWYSAPGGAEGGLLVG